MSAFSSDALGISLAAACLREVLPLLSKNVDAGTAATAVQTAAHMSQVPGGTVAQRALEAMNSDIIELLAKYLSYLSQWQRPYYTERAEIYEKQAAEKTLRERGYQPPPASSSSSSSSGKLQFKHAPLSADNRAALNCGLHVMAQHIRTATAVVTKDAPADAETRNEVMRMLVFVLTDVMGRIDAADGGGGGGGSGAGGASSEPVTWLTGTAMALARLLEHQKPRQLLLEATALLDVYCALMRAQAALMECYTTWPAFTAAGLRPMYQFALALLQPTVATRPSGAVEQVLVELSQAWFKIRYHPCVEPAYSQAMALIQDKQPESDSDDEGEAEGGAERNALPPAAPPVYSRWCVYNALDAGQRLCWSALTGVCTALAHSEQQQQHSGPQHKVGVARGFLQKPSQQQQQQSKGPQHQEAAAKGPQPKPAQQQQRPSAAPEVPPGVRKGWPIVKLQQRLPCPTERRLMQGAATLVDLTPANGQALLKAAAGALLGAALWGVWPGVVRDMLALRRLAEVASVTWVEPRLPPAAGNSSSEGDGVSDAQEGSEQASSDAGIAEEEGSEEYAAGGAGRPGFLSGARSTAVAGFKALGSVLTRAASREDGWRFTPGGGSDSGSPRPQVRLVPYTPSREAVVWCTALEAPFCPCCSNRTSAGDPGESTSEDSSAQQQQQQKAGEHQQQQEEDKGQLRQQAAVAEQPQEPMQPQPQDGQMGAEPQQQQQQHTKETPSSAAAPQQGSGAATGSSGSKPQAPQPPCAVAAKAAVAATAPRRRAGAGSSSGGGAGGTAAHKHNQLPWTSTRDTDQVSRQESITKQLRTFRIHSKLPYPRPGDLLWPHLPGTSAAWLVTQPTLVPPLGPPEEVAARLALLLEAAVRQSKVDLKPCSTLLLVLAVTLLRAQEEVRVAFLRGVQGQVLLQLLLGIVQAAGFDDPGSISYRTTWYGCLGAGTPAVMSTAVHEVPARMLSWGVCNTEVGGPTAVLLLLTWCFLVPRSDWPPLAAAPFGDGDSSNGGCGRRAASDGGDSDSEEDGYSGCSDYDVQSARSVDGRYAVGGGSYGVSSSGGFPPPRPPCPTVDLASCLHHGCILSDVSTGHHLVMLSAPAAHFKLSTDVPRSPLLLLLLEALLRRCPAGLYPATAVTQLLLGFLQGTAWVHCSAAELAPLASLLVTLSKRVGDMLLIPGVSVLGLLGDSLTLVQRVVLGALGLQLARPLESGLHRSLLGSAVRLLLVATRGLQQQLPEWVAVEAAAAAAAADAPPQGGVADTEKAAAAADEAHDAAPDNNGTSNILEVDVRHLVPRQLRPTGMAFMPAVYALAWAPSRSSGLSAEASADAATPTAPSIPADLQFKASLAMHQQQQQKQQAEQSVAGVSDPAAVTLLAGVVEALLVVPVALGLVLQPGWLISTVQPQVSSYKENNSSSSSSRGFTTGSSHDSSGSTISSGSSAGKAVAGSPGHRHTTDAINQVLGSKLQALEKVVNCNADQLLAGVPPGASTLGGLLAAVEAAAVGVAGRVGSGGGAWCGALTCANMGGCSEAELVVGQRQVVCGCCGVVAYCSPACLHADAAAGRLRHHRRLPGAAAGRGLDMCD